MPVEVSVVTKLEYRYDDSSLITKRVASHSVLPAPVKGIIIGRVRRPLGIYRDGRHYEEPDPPHLQITGVVTLYRIAYHLDRRPLEALEDNITVLI